MVNINIVTSHVIMGVVFQGLEGLKYLLQIRWFSSNIARSIYLLTYLLT